ncbi:UL16-binding protein 1-like isoform X2 [Erinaceus europaeus]|uniref:UL16-binding protein 1-like isoform X2 n=1 Tax=Erinaceus europaeus TaxID=9365 RepID=A0ABM3YJT0_ERIEU|nr:UL16-binding protein 1-like isoform X2 [Erinaceus europaeus]
MLSPQPICCFLIQIETYSSHSLCINFTITVRNSAGSQWCEAVVQLLVHQEEKLPLFNYTCENHKRPDSWLTPLSHLWAKVDIDTRSIFTETLRDLMEELKKKILDLQQETSTNSGPLSLQGSIQYQVGINGSKVVLPLSFQGEEVVKFEWTHQGLKVHSANKSMEEKWKKYKEVIELFKKIPGEFKMVIDSLSKFLNKVPQTTEAPTLTAGAVTAPANTTASSHVHWFIPIAISVSVLVAIILLIIRHRCAHILTEMLQKVRRSFSRAMLPTCSRSVSSCSTELQARQLAQATPSSAGLGHGPADAGSRLLHLPSTHNDT